MTEIRDESWKGGSPFPPTRNSSSNDMSLFTPDTRADDTMTMAMEKPERRVTFHHGGHHHATALVTERKSFVNNHLRTRQHKDEYFEFLSQPDE